jgi:uncharacterized membrane protein
VSAPLAAAPATRAFALARALALSLVAALCLLFAAWHVARFSPTTAGIACLVGIAPWLLLCPGLVRARPRSFLAALLLTTPYLGYGLMEVLANPGARHFATATVFTAFALAVTLVACLRLSRR